MSLLRNRFFDPFFAKSQYLSSVSDQPSKRALRSIQPCYGAWSHRELNGERRRLNFAKRDALSDEMSDVSFGVVINSSTINDLAIGQLSNHEALFHIDQIVSIYVKTIGEVMSKEVIKTARRLFEILEYFNKVQRPLSLKEVALRFGYPVSSASAVLKSMVALGYIDFDRPSLTYMPTMRIVQLGKWVESTLFGEPGLISLVDHLNRVTEETVGIATQSDLYMQYIHVQQSPHAIQLSLQPGTIRPLARSGLGWMLLSARSDEIIEKLVRRINFEENDRKQRVDLKELMKRIRKIRKDGYVISLHTVVVGGGIIGVLLPQRRHGRVLAIGIGGPVDRLIARRTQILRSLRQGIEKFAHEEK